MHLETLKLPDLRISDEADFRHVGLYGELKRALVRDGYRFLVPPRGSSATWSRVLLLNLTFWDTNEQGDVLASDEIYADVVMHVAWHHLARRALATARASAEALFVGESIASAFDLYLVGRLLGHSPDAAFLQTQVPAMADVAAEAGMSAEAFAALLDTVAGDPEQAFEDLRELLFDASLALFRCANSAQAAEALAAFDGHRFAALLHHYELSSWVLYARAYAPSAAGEPALDPAAHAIDAALRAAPGQALRWLEDRWLAEPASC